ncbi:unnamed protein product [Linum tenue]|uniref:Uncharacterized protein n=1 Tax=Linum tenue TaxID=586396 RepID=A0AAV0JUY8_9ROSI|nr:unnamed protein product [Linum tenue]
MPETKPRSEPRIWCRGMKGCDEESVLEDGLTCQHCCSTLKMEKGSRVQIQKLRKNRKKKQESTCFRSLLTEACRRIPRQQSCKPIGSLLRSNRGETWMLSRRLWAFDQIKERCIPHNAGFRVSFLCAGAEVWTTIMEMGLENGTLEV